MGSVIAFELKEREAIGFSIETGAMCALDFSFNVSVRADGAMYTGEYNIVPKFDAQELATKNRRMKDNVKIQAIPVYEVSNPMGGNTLTIGELENG